MKTLFVYTLLAPIADKFRDDKTTTPLLTIPLKLKDGCTWEIAVLGTQNTITAVRFAIPSATHQLNAMESALFQRCRDYVLDCIRLAYDETAHFLELPGGVPIFSNWLEPGEGPDFAINLAEPINPDYRVPIDALKMLIGARGNLQPIIHLLALAADRRSPIQFRFLSYYKIIELHYQVTPNKRFNEFCAPFVSEFGAVFSDVTDTRSLCRRLTEMRTRSAHIKLSSGERGFSHFGAQTDELTKAMPLIRRLVTRCINLNYADASVKFASSQEEVAAHHEAILTRGEQPIALRIAGQYEPGAANFTSKPPNFWNRGLVSAYGIRRKVLRYLRRKR